MDGWMDGWISRATKDAKVHASALTKSNMRNFTCIDDGKTPKNYEERICDGPHTSLFFDTTGARNMQMN